MFTIPKGNLIKRSRAGGSRIRVVGMAGAAHFASAAWERAPVQTGNRAVGSRGGTWEGKLRQGVRMCRVHAGREVLTGGIWQHTRSHTPRGGVADPESLLRSRVQAEGSPNPTMSRSSTGPTFTHRVGNVLSPGPRLGLHCALILSWLPQE